MSCGLEIQGTHSSCEYMFAARKVYGHVHIIIAFNWKAFQTSWNYDLHIVAFAFALLSSDYSGSVIRCPPACHTRSHYKYSVRHDGCVEKSQKPRYIGSIIWIFRQSYAFTPAPVDIYRFLPYRLLWYCWALLHMDHVLMLPFRRTTCLSFVSFVDVVVVVHDWIDYVLCSLDRCTYHVLVCVGLSQPMQETEREREQEKNCDCGTVCAFMSEGSNFHSLRVSRKKTFNCSLVQQLHKCFCFVCIV